MSMWVVRNMTIIYDNKKMDLKELQPTGNEKAGSREMSKPIEKLKPFEVIDADGATRQVFTFNTKNGNNLQALFYTREELPFSKEAIEGKKAVVLGAPPKHRGVAEWDQFLKDVQAESKDGEFPLNAHNSKINEAVANNEAIFLVENTPIHLIDLALWMGVDNKDLPQLRQNIAHKKGYGQKGLTLLDDLVAGTLVGPDGKLRKRENQEGEALTVLALTGDPEARSELDKRRKVIDGYDVKREERLEGFTTKKLAELSMQGVKKPDSVRATHVTKYKPEITPEGVKLHSTFDGSDEKLTRNTIHLSLKGEITSSFGGAGGDISWEEMPYVVSGDLVKMREANGNPLMVNPVDTYFVVNPGEPLVVPEGHVTMPGLLPLGTVRETRGQVTYYKNQDLQPQDIDAVFTDYYDGEGSYMQQRIQDFYKDKILQSVWRETMEGKKEAQLAPLQTALKEALSKVDPESIFSQMRKQEMGEAIDAIFQDTGLTLQQREIIKSETNKMLVKSIRDGTMYDWVSMGGGAGSEGPELELLAASWGTKGSTRSQAHSEDGDAAAGMLHKAGDVFNKVKEAEEAEKRWKRRQAEATASPQGNTLVAPWPEPVYYDFQRNHRVEKDNRQSIMEAFRNNRIDFTHINNSNGDTRIWMPQHRRMFYLAGVI